MTKISPFLVPFLLFLLTAPSFPSAISATNGAVYDIDGKKVTEDKSYYIGPVNWANGGGIKLTDKKNNKTICPFDVVQDPKEVNHGGQFMFTPIAPNERTVRLSSILGINSGNPKGPCEKSTFWKIEDPEAKAPANFITTGGEFESEVSCFQVVKYPKPTNPKVTSYMLQLCPSFCGAGPQTCFNISLYNDHGTKHLATTGTPFEFVFKKASK